MKLLLNISPIKVPPFNCFEYIASLCIPITCIKFILLFNKIIGHPDEPLSVGILCSNSKPIIFFIWPLAQAASSPKGCSIENTSISLYIPYPLLK